MRDMQAYLEKLRIQVAECEMIRDLATDPQKRELFARFDEHHKFPGAEIERVITDKSGIADTSGTTRPPANQDGGTTS